MKLKKNTDTIVRFFGFLAPWLAFTLLQHYVLHIHGLYTMMMYGGIAALVSITVRDEILAFLDKSQPENA